MYALLVYMYICMYTHISYMHVCLQYLWKLSLWQRDVFRQHEEVNIRSDSYIQVFTLNLIHTWTETFFVSWNPNFETFWRPKIEYGGCTCESMRRQCTNVYFHKNIILPLTTAIVCEHTHTHYMCTVDGGLRRDENQSWRWVTAACISHQHLFTHVHPHLTDVLSRSRLTQVCMSLPFNIYNCPFEYLQLHTLALSIITVAYTSPFYTHVWERPLVAK